MYSCIAIISLSYFAVCGTTTLLLWFKWRKSGQCDPWSPEPRPIRSVA